MLNPASAFTRRQQGLSGSRVYDNAAADTGTTIPRLAPTPSGISRHASDVKGGVGGVLRNLTAEQLNASTAANVAQQNADTNRMEAILRSAHDDAMLGIEREKIGSGYYKNDSQNAYRMGMLDAANQRNDNTYANNIMRSLDNQERIANNAGVQEDRSAQGWARINKPSKPSLTVPQQIAQWDKQNQQHPYSWYRDNNREDKYDSEFQDLKRRRLEFINSITGQSPAPTPTPNPGQDMRDALSDAEPLSGNIASGMSQAPMEQPTGISGLMQRGKDYIAENAYKAIPSIANFAVSPVMTTANAMANAMPERPRYSPQEVDEVNLHSRAAFVKPAQQYSVPNGDQPDRETMLVRVNQMTPDQVGITTPSLSRGPAPDIRTPRHDVSWDAMGYDNQNQTAIALRRPMPKTESYLDQPLPMTTGVPRQNNPRGIDYSAEMPLAFKPGQYTMDGLPADNSGQYTGPIYSPSQINAQRGLDKEPFIPTVTDTTGYPDNGAPGFRPYRTLADGPTRQANIQALMTMRKVPREVAESLYEKYLQKHGG